MYMYIYERERERERERLQIDESQNILYDFYVIYPAWYSVIFLCIS